MAANCVPTTPVEPRESMKFEPQREYALLQHSVRAIEDCGLDTAIPTFKPPRGTWPVWADIGPDTLPESRPAFFSELSH